MLIHAQTKELYDSILLASHAGMSSDAIAPFVTALKAILTSDNSTTAREEFQETEMSSAVIVTALLELLGAAKAADGLQPDVVQQIIAIYGWHRSVMAALAGLYESGCIQRLPDTCLPLLVQQVLVGRNS